MVMRGIHATMKELRALNRLTFYAVMVNSIDAGFGVVTLIMLGHLGKGHLSAGIIALAIYNMAWYFIEGVLTAQDSFVSRAFARADAPTARYWSWITLVVALLLCIPATLLFVSAAVLAEWALQISAHTAAKAGAFLLLLLPALYAQSAYRVAQKYLQAQNYLRVPMACGLLGISLNLLIAYLMMFQWGWGFTGAALANSIGRVAMLGAIGAALMGKEDPEELSEQATHVYAQLATRTHSFCARPAAVALTVVAWVTGTERGADSTHGAALRKSNKIKRVSRRRDGKIAPVGVDLEDIEVDAEADRDPEEGLEMVGLLGGGGGSSEGGGRGAGAGECIKEAVGSVADKEASAGVAVGGEGGKGENAREEREGDEKEDEDEVEEINEDDDVPLLGPPTSTSAPPTRQQRGWGSTALDAPSDVARFLVLGLPGGFLLGADAWALEVATALVAHMGSVPIDAHQIQIVVTSILYLSLPFAVSVAATVHITRLLVAQNAPRARTMAWLCIFEGATLMTLAALLVYLLRDDIPYIFTSNEDVANRAKGLAPYSLGLQVAYGVYAPAQGVLRATSHHADALWYTIGAMWLVGLPIGSYLAFIVRPTYNLAGLWIGLVLGASLLAGSLLLQVLCLDWDKEVRQAVYRLRRGADRVRRPRRQVRGGGEGGAGGGGGDLEDSAEVDAEGEADFDFDEVFGDSSATGISYNPLRTTEADLEAQMQAQAQAQPGGIESTGGMGAMGMGLAALPGMGSRSLGLLSPHMGSMFPSEEEELREFEYVEFGPGGAEGVGVGAGVTDTDAEAEGVDESDLKIQRRLERRQIRSMNKSMNKSRTSRSARR
ncbi:mate-domain-containing protein [Ochromonadaceae sp. CCMP2298]|nr:mate-domain-containing protein [Ochromonadaceae sp. CCMP2298]